MSGATKAADVTRWKRRRHAIYALAAIYGLDNNIVQFIIDICELGQFDNLPKKITLVDTLAPKLYACGEVFLCGCPVINRQLTYHFYWRELGEDGCAVTNNAYCKRIADSTCKVHRLAHVAYSVIASHKSPCQQLFPAGDGENYDQVVQCESGYIPLVSDKGIAFWAEEVWLQRRGFPQ